MNNTANKKDVFYIVVLILTFITVIVGATFALYAFIFSQEEGTSAVYTGTLSIEYLSGEIINFNLLYPTEKPTTIETTKNVYKNNFRVTNTGSLDSIISIEIDIKENQFSNKTLQYSLYSGEEEVNEGYIEGKTSTIIASNVVLKNKETADYTLLIWIAENGENQNEEMKKTLTGAIQVNAAQKID